MAFGEGFFNKIDRDLGLKEDPASELSQAEKEYLKLRQSRADKKQQEQTALEKELEEKRAIQEKETFERKGKELIFEPDSLEQLFAEAQKRVGSTDIDAELFSTIYPAEEVQADIAAVQELEALFEKQASENESAAAAKQMATIFEAILTDGVTRYNWFGEKIKILPPSKYDDFKGGVDGILEIDKDEAGSEYAALGIDATFGSAESVFKKKIFKNLDTIGHGHLTRVKYFLTDDEQPVAKFYIPKIILATDIGTLAELSFLWKHRTNAEYKDKLKKHKIRYDIINQIKSQCEFFASHARMHGQEHIAEAYADILQTLFDLAEISPEVKQVLNDMGDMQKSAELQTLLQEYEWHAR